MVNELVPLFGATIAAIVVRVGLILIFRDWIKKRDDLIPRRPCLAGVNPQKQANHQKSCCASRKRSRN